MPPRAGANEPAYFVILSGAKNPGVGFAVIPAKAGIQV
jgi:hypothetical protein